MKSFLEILLLVLICLSLAVEARPQGLPLALAHFPEVS
jgi:hypothetical protein